MANRLTKIYTRAGDGGMTRLAHGERVTKSSSRIESIGTVDETNSSLGLVLAEDLPAKIRACLERIQHELFDVGGELGSTEYAVVNADYVSRLEEDLDEFNADLPALKEFILPGGSVAAAACHLARATCRRAERRVWKLVESEQVNAEIPKYLNRLSDLLFVVARVLARRSGATEAQWRPERDRSSNSPAE